MPPKKKPTKKGGARPGAGPKIGPHGKRIGTSVTLTADVLEYLNATGSRSDKIEELVRKTASFKEFLAAKEISSKIISNSY